MDEGCKKDRLRMDAMDEWRTKSDAAEKEKADKAKTDSAAGHRADATGENRNAFAGSQLRLDSACQAWGHQCRAPLAGESLRDYRISILNGLKHHSKAYKDSD